MIEVSRTGTLRAIGHALPQMRKIDTAIPICRQAAVVYARTRSEKQPFPTLEPNCRTDALIKAPKGCQCSHNGSAAFRGLNRG